jgi:hypothetical protein
VKSILKHIRPGQPVSIAPLVTFRIVFGLLMAASLLRFMWNGWVTSVYVQPRFHFTYSGFEWVQPLGSTGMYALFILATLASLCIALGFRYRLAAILFFLGFTYIELIDVTTYLNHYYFISLISFIMIWLPANRSYSVDTWLAPSIKRDQVPAWCISIIRFQMAVVYVFAGLAKLNADWLFEAQPLRTWLPAKTHLPIVGRFMYEPWVAYLFAWFGAAYDLLIAFFLLYGHTRLIAYAFVIIFHVATAIFFPGIGMFPYVMILCSLIFFSGAFHHRLLSSLPFYSIYSTSSGRTYTFHPSYKHILSAGIAIYVFIQLAVPLRFMLYPGHLFWHEEGYRFSWRVMLMEKSGAAYFTIKDKATHQFSEVTNAAYLTPLQEKMMSTQPDMILKYAHFLASEYRKKGMRKPEVYGEVYVALNGKRSRHFIDTNVDLAMQPLSWGHYNWVLPY